MSLERLRYPIDALRGRKYPEPAHRYRNEFQRDRDRIVHARAFRRLEDKTQVFGERLSDHFRNRLTHTIEVSQIARTLAVALGLAEDFTEALALAHDIGHPPFAHAGEEALDGCMREFGDRFDHNVHALHIVESFELRYARFPGLNLTFEVREGMVKHSRDFAPGECTEFDEYLPGLRPPLEAQLIDLADEVAYNTADLDDGHSAGLFSMDDIATELPHYAELAAEIRFQFPGAPEKVQFQEVLRRLIDLLVSGLIEGTTENVESHKIDSVDAVRHHPTRLVAMTASAAETNSGLKKFLLSRVYSSPALVEERVHACQGIDRMFRFFLDHPEELPEGHSERIGLMPAHRVVCDYIAGMTDGFFRRTAARLFA
ncbi:dGTP triphosphohydrolase [uncultured Paludibaculum sp.]|uniref:deoxyguanosinetriphosphate triphosphohydrolase family protein n=1 Tax=uncultured Paludibaculum sp. TaxID=1765020 RepID=UPI002AAAF724|nr:dNTP triphosphohydrolase [uncultured Paludibaculum sp.]